MFLQICYPHFTILLLCFLSLLDEGNQFLLIAFIYIKDLSFHTSLLSSCLDTLLSFFFPCFFFGSFLCFLKRKKLLHFFCKKFSNFGEMIQRLKKWSAFFFQFVVSAFSYFQVRWQCCSSVVDNNRHLPPTFLSLLCL